MMAAWPEPAASMTASISSAKASQGGRASRGTGSEAPVPNWSNRMTLAKLARCWRKRRWAGSSHSTSKEPKNPAADREHGPGTDASREGQPPRSGFGWRRLQIATAFGVLVSLALPMLIQGSAEIFLLAIAAPFVIGLLVMRRSPPVGAIWLGVSSLAVLLSSAPFLADALAHPESLSDFVPLVIFGISTLVGVVATIPSFRLGAGSDLRSSAARSIGAVAVASVFVAILVSVASFSGIESAPARPGDVRLVAQDLRFVPAQIEADGGRISVLVTNRDSTRHTFTVDELGGGPEHPARLHAEGLVHGRSGHVPLLLPSARPGNGGSAGCEMSGVAHPWVGPPGLEPGTCGLRVRCSVQLS